MGRVLVIAAHPDDEVLGCGGTICRHVAQGDDVGIIFLTDGEGARAKATAASIVHRSHAATDACRIMGATILAARDFPDNGMDRLALIDIIHSIEDDAIAFNPDIVYTHFAHDLNCDHAIARNVTMTIFRPQPKRPRPNIFGFQIPSSTGWQGAEASQFNPAHFVDITDYTATKMEALRCYDSEMRPSPHVRSYEGVDVRDRAMGMLVGVSAAEAFVVERQFMR